MLITTNGGQLYEVNTADEVIALLAPMAAVRPPVHRTREQLLSSLADLGEEAGLANCQLLAESIRTIVNASRYPVATKSHLVSLGRHMVAACEPLAETA